MSLEAIAWDDSASALVLLDQRALPESTQHLRIRTVAALVEAIRTLAVRGAPALGIAGAYGVVIALDEAARKAWSPERRDAAIEQLRLARPTAVNLAWGVDQVSGLIPAGRAAVLAAAAELHEADVSANRELSRIGADWLIGQVPGAEGRGLRLLTHCNAGALATGGWGTALGVVRELHERDRLAFVYADETRPLLQGARLTAYELAAEGVPHAVQVDGAAASTILSGRVDAAVVGSDRIAANGDVANKIGTLAVALACRDAGVPFLVAAPWSTVDLHTPSGSDIEIELRDGREVLEFAETRCAPAESTGFNPAFDVTPARLVSAIVTERGLLAPDELRTHRWPAAGRSPNR